MDFVFLPIEDALDIFGAEYIEYMRHNVANTEVIVHKSILMKRMEDIGMMVLPEPIEGEEPQPVELPYPVLSGQELDDTLASDAWTSKEEPII